MRLIYQISLFFYAVFIRIASPFNPKAKAWINGRKNKTWKNLDTNGKEVIWFHCASLGEFDIALPLMEKWKVIFPNDFILVTFFSPSGMENYSKRKHAADFVTYIPLDTPSNAKEFIANVKPKTVFFVKYEFWAFHLFEAKKRGAKIFSVNTLFRKDQVYFKKYGGFYRKILRVFDHFFVQNENSKHLLQSIQIQNATVTGDLRFDRVFQNKNRVSENPILADWLKDEKAFIVGSSWPIDENLLMPLFHSLDIKQKVIIAPHEVNDSHIKSIESQLQLPSIRYSAAIEKQGISSEVQVVILNTIGHLTNSFQYGDLAYIGGGFTGKLHNILEPAVFGLPVMIGPKHAKFPEAQIFINKGFAFEVKNEKDVLQLYLHLQQEKNAIQLKLLSFMENQIGVSDKIIGLTQENL